MLQNLSLIRRFAYKCDCWQTGTVMQCDPSLGGEGTRRGESCEGVTEVTELEEEVYQGHDRSAGDAGASCKL